MGGFRAAVAGAVLCALLGAVSAGAAVPAPPTSALLLSPADFDPGAVVAADTTVTKLGTQVLLRLFRGAKLGGQPVVAVAECELLADENTASSQFAIVRTELGLNVAKKAIADLFAAEFAKGMAVGSAGKSKVTVKSTVVGAPVSVGGNGFRLAMTFVTNTGRFRAALGFTHADRALGIVLLIPFGGKLIGSGKVSRVVEAEAAHLRSAFTVASVSPPTISGTPTQGQTLTASMGSWTGAPSSFAYAWSRCDPTGAACSPIAGATSSTYVVGPADAGATLRSGVTGSNSVGSAQATSQATVVVM